MRLVALICAAEVLSMLGFFAFPALLPTFLDAWELTHAEAGWIAGVSFGAYALGVPVLVTLTDRVDARFVYAGGAGLAAASSLGFAALANGFWSAFSFRALAGLALGATYMPGLRVLVDRYRGPHRSRAVAFYTASFSLGTAGSFMMAGEVAEAFGWRWAFATAGIGGALAGFVAMTLRPVVPQGAQAPPAPWLAFRPVWRNRASRAYMLGYGVHCWELFTLRSWMVAFLAFSLGLQSVAGDFWPAPTTVATLGALLAMGSSLAGNELCIRLGRPRVISGVMLLSVAAAFSIGFTAALPYGWVVVAVLAYSVVVQLDSAALTSGAVEAAEPTRQGATLAIHSLIGFCAGFIGPAVLGMALDLAGGASSPWAWGIAFGTVGLVGLLGPLVLALAPPNNHRGPTLRRPALDQVSERAR